MLVVLAIIGVISAILIRRGSLNPPEVKLDLAAQDLATAIRQAQISGSTGSGLPGSDAYEPMTNNEDASSIAYGVSLKKKQEFLTFFRDKNNSHQFDYNDSLVFRYYFPSGVKLTDVILSDPTKCDMGDAVIFLFKVPFITLEELYCKPSGIDGLTNIDSDYIGLTLGIDGSTKKRQVKINQAGFIQIISI